MLKKTSEARPLSAKVVNVDNNSETDTYSCKYINDCNTYSTSETFTGEYWLDGKKIYRKCIPITMSNATATTEYAHNITNLDHFVKEYGYIYNSTSSGFRPLPFADGTSTNCIRIDANTTTIIVRQYASWSGYSGYVVVEYTKTS